MTDPLFVASEGATPLDEDEAEGLRPTWVRTRGDLNAAEAANILAARRAVRSPTLDEVLDDLWLRRLHERMFGDVWTWAGSYRLSDRNIGVDWTTVPAAVRALVGDCRTWVEFDAGEIAAARFHHRLVAIHPFPNGNGRHARAAADHLSSALSLPPPSWGARDLDDDITALRAAYLDALRTADRDPQALQPLIAFMWS